MCLSVFIFTYEYGTSFDTDNLRFSILIFVPTPTSQQGAVTLNLICSLFIVTDGQLVGAQLKQFDNNFSVAWGEHVVHDDRGSFGVNMQCMTTEYPLLEMNMQCVTTEGPLLGANMR